MPTVVRDALASLGQRSPMVLAGGYLAIMLVVGALVRQVDDRALLMLGLAIWFVSGIVLVVLAAWYREEDTVAVGGLVGLIVVGTGLVSRLLIDIVVTRSIGGAVLTFMGSILSLFVNVLIAVPICIALVWAARQVAPGFGVTPASEPKRRVPAR